MNLQLHHLQHLIVAALNHQRLHPNQTQFQYFAILTGHSFPFPTIPEVFDTKGKELPINKLDNQKIL